ncbi:MAG: DUF2085 domain-containing protein [Chloroflexi bacterium]|nr:DUF2085 domain-containing protein [Chloroflexota bacterium]
MIQATLFISKADNQFEAIIQHLDQLQNEHPHELSIIDIDREPVLQSEYADKAPVLDIGVYRITKTFEIEDIKLAFEKSEARLEEAQAKGNQVLVRRISEPLEMEKADRFSHWFSRKYMLVFNAVVFLYVFFAFLAPGLMKIGWVTPAKVIYKVYSPLCHQLGYRTFYLFGEQPYYPSQMGQVDGLLTFGMAAGIDENNVNAARSFLGNETMGYKTALCQRDVAIYSAIFVFGLIFSVFGRRIKPLPWYIWILLGLGPIGLDGFSQLLGQTGWAIFDWIPLRESTPMFRVVTGGLFGLTSAWFGYPYMEESIKENRREMQLKQAIVSQIEAQRGKRT